MVLGSSQNYSDASEKLQAHLNRYTLPYTACHTKCYTYIYIYIYLYKYVLKALEIDATFDILSVTEHSRWYDFRLFYGQDFSFASSAPNTEMLGTDSEGPHLLIRRNLISGRYGTNRLVVRADRSSLSFPSPKGVVLYCIVLYL